MELEGVIPALHLVVQFCRLSQHELIDRLHLFKGNPVGVWAEVIQIAEDVAERVADLAIVLRHTLHELLRANHVFAEVDGCNPKTHDFCSQTVCNIDGVDVIALGLRHRMSVLVECPSRGSYHAIRSMALVTHRAQQGRVEPPAVLIPTLEIQVSWPGKIGFVAQHSGFEPHVENVGLFFEFCAAAARASGSFRNKRIGFRREPGVCSEASEELDQGMVDGFVV